MKYLMFDTNIFLSRILPYHFWRDVSNQVFTDLSSLGSSSPFSLITVDLIRLEIERIITSLSNFILEEFKVIISGFPDLAQPFSSDNLKELTSRFNQAIVSQQDYKTKDSQRNILLFVENYLLTEIFHHKLKNKDEHFFTVFNFLTTIKSQLLALTDNYLVQNNIKKLSFPSEKLEQQKIATIKRKLNFKNNADAKILSHFIYFLQQQSTYSGFFITHDFGDFLVYSSAIEQQFPCITLTRPGYVKCFL